MKLFGIEIRRASASGVRPLADAGGRAFSLNDPNLVELLRTGSVSTSGALKNGAVFRAVDLISGVIGALPLTLQRRMGDRLVEAADHPLHKVLMLRPNDWQSPLDFKRLMQHWVLLHGNAYAQIVRSGQRVIALNPIHPERVAVEQQMDFSLRYRLGRAKAAPIELPASDILHLRGPSDDGIVGLSRVRQAADVIQIGLESQLAALRVFRNGMMVGGVLSHPGKLSKEAKAKLAADITAHSGAENAGKWVVFEEGLKVETFEHKPVDSQLVEIRAQTVDDIGRIFGVPRPLLGVADTSWGSGIEQLAILFVRFGLAPWFKVWEDALSVSCLTEAERGLLLPDFQERELLRGTIKDQFEAYARAAGAGGHMPWMTPNEIRSDTGLSPHPDGDRLQPAGAPASKESLP